MISKTWSDKNHQMIHKTYTDEIYIKYDIKR